MLRAYIDAAMHRANYRRIRLQDTHYFGSIPQCPGVSAAGRTLTECQSNLENTLDRWLLANLVHGQDVPEFDGHKPVQIKTLNGLD